MGQISFTPLQDGVTSVSAANTNTPLNTIYNEFNGNIDATNIKSGAITDTQMATSASPVTRGSETFYDFVASGGVITADSAGSTLNWSMTSGVVYIGGKRVTFNALSGIAATASKDTYVDVDNTGTVTYTGGNVVSNNAASPSLAANSVRLGIIVSGASSIAASTSINQGQENRVLPIASSIPYAVTDSLGNLICPRDPNRKILGYRQITSTATTTATASGTAITGLSVPIIVPANRKIVCSLWSDQVKHSASTPIVDMWDGTVGSGTQITRGLGSTNTSSGLSLSVGGNPVTLASGSHTINAGFWGLGAGTTTFEGNGSYPAYLKVELV